MSSWEILRSSAWPFPSYPIDSASEPCGHNSYFEHIDRIATRQYEPSDNDVLRARLRTLGVQENKLVFEHYGTSCVQS